MPDSVTLRGYAFDDYGRPIPATVTVYKADTTVVAGSTTADAATGAWEITLSGIPAGEGRYDIETRYGAIKRLDKGRTLRGGTVSAAVERTTPQAIAQNVFVTVTGYSVIWDRAGMFNAAQPDRLTCQVPGLYLVTAHLAWAGMGADPFASYVYASLTRNAWAPASGWAVHTPNLPLDYGGSPVGLYQSVAAIMNLAVGDYIQLVVLSATSASTRNLNAATLTATRLD